MRRSGSYSTTTLLITYGTLPRIRIFIPKRLPFVRRSGPRIRPRTIPDPSMTGCICGSLRISNTVDGAAATSRSRVTIRSVTGPPGSPEKVRADDVSNLHRHSRGACASQSPHAGVRVGTNETGQADARSTPHSRTLDALAPPRPAPWRSRPDARGRCDDDGRRTDLACRGPGHGGVRAAGQRRRPAVALLGPVRVGRGPAGRHRTRAILLRLQRRGTTNRSGDAPDRGHRCTQLPHRRPRARR